MTTIAETLPHKPSLLRKDTLLRLAQYCVVMVGFCLPVSHAGTSIFSALAVLFILLTPLRKNILGVIRRNPFVWSLLALYALMLLSAFYTSADNAMLLKTLKKYVRIGFLPFYLFLFSDKRLRQIGIKTFLAATFILSLIALAKFLGVSHYRGGTPDNLFMNRIETSFFMAFSAFIAAYYWMTDKTRFKWLYALLSVSFCFNVLFVSSSRTGYLTLALLAVVFIVQQFRLKGLLIGFVALPLVAGVITLSSPRLQQYLFTNTFHELKDYSKGNDMTSTGVRLLMAKTAIRVGMNNPIIGTGAGSSQTEYHKYNLPKLPAPLRWGDPHNQYFYVFVEFGVLGLSLLLLTFLQQLYISTTKSIDMQFLAQAMIICFMIAGLSDSFFYLSSTGNFYIYFSGLLFASSITTEKNEANQYAKPG